MTETRTIIYVDDLLTALENPRVKSLLNEPGCAGMLYHALKRLRTKGYSWRKLSETLNQAGIRGTSGNNIRRFFQRGEKIAKENNYDEYVLERDLGWLTVSEVEQEPEKTQKGLQKEPIKNQEMTPEERGELLAKEFEESFGKEKQRQPPKYATPAGLLK